jgi:hypothetical protein
MITGRGGALREFALPGGFVNSVVRVGGTVRRAQPDHAEFVHALLGLFEQHGWAGALRFVGIDSRGREILSYLQGHAAWEHAQPAGVGSDRSLARVAELVREFHDMTAGTSLAGGQEVVCHNDLSPKNTIYRDAGAGLRPVAFIDWDLAAPGARIHDVAHACWQYLGLGPGIADLDHASRGVRLISDAYGLADRDRLVETILWWQDRCWRGIESAAAAGEPAMIRLRDSGAARAVRDACHWVADQRAGLEAALR